MFDRPEIMRMAQELATHASARQSEIARNVANADTPGYRARDVASFTTIWSDDRSSSPAPRATRLQHVRAAEPASARAMVFDDAAEPSPNGNTVSLEREVVKSAEVRHDHELALAVYKSSLDMMRTVIGKGR